MAWGMTVSATASLVDPSCYHSSFAALLAARRPLADPTVVLGANAATAVRRGTDGTLVFGDPIEPLAAAARRAGYDLMSHPVGGAEDWQPAVAALADGQSIAVAADYFHLPHYWPGQGRLHGLHIVALHGWDPTAAALGLQDLGDVIYFDGRVPMTVLEGAMYGSAVGQAWYELIPASDRAIADGVLAEFAGQLAGPGTNWLSGTELIQALRDGMDAHLSQVGARSRGNWGFGQRLPLGLWWYHHTLRWFTRYLASSPAAAASGKAAVAGEAVGRAAQDVLVIRNLIMRLGAIDAGASRARSFRTQLDRRLSDAEHNLGQAAADVAVLAGAVP
jgi:hypothetical protein